MTQDNATLSPPSHGDAQSIRVKRQSEIQGLNATKRLGEVRSAVDVAVDRADLDI